MSRRPVVRPLALATCLAVASAVGALGVTAPTPAGAATDPATLTGAGGTFLQPVVSKLLKDDSSGVAPLFGGYAGTDIDSGIASFVGTGPGQFGADFAVSERPLSTVEAASAKANGRSFAYVPIASTPVAIFTLVPTNAWGVGGSGSIGPSDFCQHLQLTTTLLGQLLGLDQQSPLHYWGDSRISCPTGTGTTTADNLPVASAANLDPSMANFALLSLLDSTPTSKSLLDAGLAGPGSLTTSDTPSEKWPYAQGTIPGGDQPLVGKLLAINPETNTPSSVAVAWSLGSIGPISSVWTGSPLGVPWDLPTAAVQNAQGSFVAPTAPSAQAAASDATLAATTDPTSNNLVTFNASSTDAAAYNSYLMEESYLVVPTSGLAPAKAAALAQFVRFVLGPQGQQDIAAFGAAPATTAMQAAGLRVAAQLNAEAVAATTPASTAATTTTSTTTAAPAAPTASDAGSSGSATGSGSSGAAATTDPSAGLAFTGAGHPFGWAAAGLVLVLVGAVTRRRIIRRGVTR